MGRLQDKVCIITGAAGGQGEVAVELFAREGARILASDLKPTASARIAKVAADRPPCFQALRLPTGAPGFVPPCILHRRLPLTAGDWHSVPKRVRARQRGACASRAGCIGLFD